MLWLILFALCLSCFAAWQMIRTRFWRSSLVIVLLSATVPTIWVSRYCVLDRVSEACVWGQTLLPFYYLFTTFVVSPVLYLLFLLCLMRYRRKRNMDSSAGL